MTSDATAIHGQESDRDSSWAVQLILYVPLNCSVWLYEQPHLIFLNPVTFLSKEAENGKKKKKNASSNPNNVKSPRLPPPSITGILANQKPMYAERGGQHSLLRCSTA